MKNVPLKNDRLLTLLSNVIDDFYTGEVDKIIKSSKPIVDKRIPDLHPTSAEYLREAMRHDWRHYGYPQGVWGFGMTAPHHRDPEPVERLRDKIGMIIRRLGVQRNALIMGYPDDGYIGWHHNGNAPGYNILFTYSQDGDGNFSFWDHDTKSIVKLQDQPGWNVRVGYYPNERTEKGKEFWHMAETKKQRVTIAFVIDHKEMWKDMISEISGYEFDVETL